MNLAHPGMTPARPGFAAARPKKIPGDAGFTPSHPELPLAIPETRPALRGIGRGRSWCDGWPSSATDFPCFIAGCCCPVTQVEAARATYLLAPPGVRKNVLSHGRIRKCVFSTVHELRAADTMIPQVAVSKPAQVGNLCHGAEQGSIPLPPRMTLTCDQILAWADAYFKRTGRWPTSKSGRIHAAKTETWTAIDQALRYARRGLNGSDSLAKLLARERGRLNIFGHQQLTVSKVLKWADAHHQRTGQWPVSKGGPIPEAPGESWSSVIKSLRRGSRGVGPTTLATLLAEHRGARIPGHLPDLSEEQILTWVLEHLTRTGQWPDYYDGDIPGSDRETWSGINASLRNGGRGLPGSSSLAQFLLNRFGGRTGSFKAGGFTIQLPFRAAALAGPLTEAQIIGWARQYHQRTGQWPKKTSGPIEEAPGESWSIINHALHSGCRGFQPGSSLARLLAKRGLARNIRELPDLTEDMIVEWAQEHFEQTGEWPTKNSGQVSGHRDENWSAIQSALHNGRRGLPGGDTLPRLLARERGRPNRNDQEPLTIPLILQWADAHRGRTGQWPAQQSGRVDEGRSETWLAVNSALRVGCRGLPGGDSLACLLVRERGHVNKRARGPLSLRQVLSWADSHFKRTGEWPVANSGDIPEAPGETWASVSGSLGRGSRGIKAGSIAGLLARHRGVRRPHHIGPVSEAQVLAFVLEHLANNGKWPSKADRTIPGSGGETWSAIDAGFLQGRRGLPACGSLANFLVEQFGQRSGSMEAGKFMIQLPYRSVFALSRLTETQIIGWATAHKDRTGEWPTSDSGPVADVPGETWSIIDSALRGGNRGLRADSSLARLLAKHGFVRNLAALPKLSAEKIVRWAREHHQRTGSWPVICDEVIPGSGGETWRVVHEAALHGRRGLPGTWTLHQLLVRRCQKRDHVHRPPLTLDMIRKWMRRHRQQKGHWPRAKSGAITGVRDEDWRFVDTALKQGRRGLEKGSSLSRLAQEMDVPAHVLIKPRLKIPAIMLWARAHFRRHGDWPDVGSGKIPDAPGETWAGVDEALRHGWRKIRKTTSLAEVIARTPTPLSLAGGHAPGLPFG